METPSENIFNLEQFCSNLRAKTEEFAANSWIVYGAEEKDDPSINERKKARRDALREELLKDCAEALLATNDKELTLETIRSVLLNYMHGCGYALFSPGNRDQFYHELVLRLAKKASA